MSRIAFSTDKAFCCVTATPMLHDVMVKPCARITHVVSLLQPNPASEGGSSSSSLPVVRPLTSRDALPGASPADPLVQQFALSLSYPLALTEPAKGVELSVARLHGMLYESSWDAVLLTVVNEHVSAVGPRGPRSTRAFVIRCSRAPPFFTGRLCRGG